MAEDVNRAVADSHTRQKVSKRLMLKSAAKSALDKVSQTVAEEVRHTIASDFSEQASAQKATTVTLSVTVAVFVKARADLGREHERVGLAEKKAVGP